jgi:hypothetical protein
MPTSYTYALLEKNVSFKEFAISCTRAFGALINFRDEPFNKIILTIPLDSYHTKEVIENEKKLKDFKDKTQAKKIEWAAEKILKNKKSALERLKEIQKENKVFEDMLVQVKSWIPPSKDHVNFKEFMTEQLEVSISNTKYYENDLTSVETSIAEVIKTHIEYLEENIKYHKENEQKEINRQKINQLWVDQIVNSFN